MGSFSNGIETKLAFRRGNGVYVYSAIVDQTWAVKGIPHGGYLLSIVLHALNSLQSTSKPFHPDPVHLTSSFLRAASPGKLEVELDVIKTGRNWTNISIRVVQNGQPLILAQALYTLLPPLPNTAAPYSTSHQHLLPSTPSPYAYKSPFLTHPSQCSPIPLSSEEGRRWSSNSIFWFLPDKLKWSEDPALKKKREGNGIEKRLELEWGAWMEFTDAEDANIDIAGLGFFSDMMSSIPELFPPGQVIDPHYYPTMAMSIQFHAKLPLPSNYLSSAGTIGCYSKGNLIHAGRHEQLTEVWTAPSSIQSKDGIQPNWREKSMILLTATQIALSVPIAGMKVAPGPKPKL